MSVNKDIVQRYMNAYSRWDHAGILACLTNDIEWVVPGAFHITGHAAVDNEIEGHGSAGPPEIAITRLTEENDVVVAEGMVRAALEDGGVLNLSYCDVFVLRDGLISHLTSYLVLIPDEDAVES